MSKPTEKTLPPVKRSTAKAVTNAMPAPADVVGERAFLEALGERVRSLRARRGLTRRGLAQSSGVSERHLANLETGVGNASALVLRQVASALDSPVAALLGDETTASPEWLLIRDVLRGRNDDELRDARTAIAQLFGQGPANQRHHIALIGLRGAGKSTLGKMMADAMKIPFVELNQEIEREAGCSVPEIHNLLGPNAYRRYEKRALEQIISSTPAAVIATPGGIVADPATFGFMLAHCTTVWLKTSPAEHMQRVLAQGDLRPMRGNREAMEDLKRILDTRAAFYKKADLIFDTSGLVLDDAFNKLLTAVQARLKQAAA